MISLPVDNILRQVKSIEFVFHKEWCNYLEDIFMKRFYTKREFKIKM